MATKAKMSGSEKKVNSKPLQDDTKLCQLQLSVNKFPNAASIFSMNSPVKFWQIREYYVQI